MVILTIDLPREKLLSERQRSINREQVESIQSGTATCSEGFVKCIESESGRWAVMQLPCCPLKQGELSENLLQNLRDKLPHKTVPTIRKTPLSERQHSINREQVENIVRADHGG